MKRSNLHVETNALASRVLFEGQAGGGRGVRPGRRASVWRKAASAEVILAGGHRQLTPTPAALGRSVAGDLSEATRDRGGARPAGRRREPPGPLRPWHALPAERRGGQLGERADARAARFVQASSDATPSSGAGLLDPVGGSHRGLLPSRRPDLAGPDIQFHILPATMDHGEAAPGTRSHGAGGQTWPHHRALSAPARRAEGTFASGRQRPMPCTPAIVANYLAQTRWTRRWRWRRCTWGRRIAAQAALEPYIDHEMNPGPDDRQGDEASPGLRPAWPARPSTIRSEPARWAMRRCRGGRSCSSACMAWRGCGWSTPR